MEDQKEQVNELLEDGWFFGNSLMSRSRLSKMVRCNSDPCPSSSTKETTLNFQDTSKMSNLFRTPSLPPSFCTDTKDEQEVDEVEEPRMGDLIRQAMPMSTPILMPNKRLNREPSLPPCRSKEAINMVPNIQNGVNEVGKLGRTSIDSLVSLPEKGPIGGIKLTRKASIDSSMLLPPKYTSKGTKQGGSNSKNRPQRKQLDLTMMDEPSKSESKTQTLDKSKSQKTLTDLEIEELQGFKDLGFSFDTKQVNPSVAQILPALQRQGSLDSTKFENDKVVRRPYLSESWEWRSTSPVLATPKLKRVDQKLGSAEDMKAQIKFWARAVASNVRQEC